MKQKKITWVGILVIRNGKVLMVKENDINFIVFPGGGMEDGESHEETLRREIREELGTQPKDFRKYLEVNLPGRAEDVTIHFVVFIGELLSEIKTGKDIEGIAWIGGDYEKLGKQYGHLASMVVLPRLKSEGLIV